MWVKKKNLLHKFLTLQGLMLMLLGICFGYFFGRLFWPEPGIFLTPESVRSDMWHFHYPLKDLLSDSLKNHRLPLWTNKWATGFPVLADGHIQVFFIPSLVLYGLLPTWLAWNGYFMLMTLLAGGGTYLFFRSWHTDSISALIVGGVYAFSGFLVMHYIHPNTLAAAALMPWLFYTRQAWVKKKKLGFMLAFILISWQQLVAGAPQIVLATWMMLLGYEGVEAYVVTKRYVKILPMLFAGVISLGLAAEQLLPMYELVTQSLRATGTNEVFRFPFPGKFLLLFFNPRLFGTPENGSFPLPEGDEGIYAESVLYFGVLALMLSFWGLLTSYKNNKNRSWLGIIILGLILGLGELLPTKVVFGMPVLRYFRVPNRYLWISVWGMMWFLREGLVRLRDKNHGNKWMMVIIALVMWGDLAINLGNFHPIVPVRDVQRVPKMSTKIPDKARVWTHPSVEATWYRYFEADGWKSMKPFVESTNGLSPINNSLWDINQTYFYTGLFSKRMTMLGVLSNKNVLNITATDFVISSEQIGTQELVLLETLDSMNGDRFYLYHNQEATRRIHPVQQIWVEPNLDRIPKLIMSEGFDPMTMAVIETPLPIELDPKVSGSVSVVEDTDSQLKFEVTSNGDGLWVIADSYYPGWKATIDGHSSKILPVNYNQRGVMVPEGKHEVELTYQPDSYNQGVGLAILTALALAVILFTPKLRQILCAD
jgi:hypothetical protein